MPLSSVRTFTDPDQYAAAIRARTVSVAVTQHGRFRAKICRIDFHDLWMQRFSEDLSRIGHTDEWGGRAVVAFGRNPARRS